MANFEHGRSDRSSDNSAIKRVQWNPTKGKLTRERITPLPPDLISAQIKDFSGDVRIQGSVREPRLTERTIVSSQTEMSARDTLAAYKGKLHVETGADFVSIDGRSTDRSGNVRLLGNQNVIVGDNAQTTITVVKDSQGKRISEEHIVKGGRQVNGNNIIVDDTDMSVDGKRSYVTQGLDLSVKQFLDTNLLNIAGDVTVDGVKGNQIIEVKKGKIQVDNTEMLDDSLLFTQEGNVGVGVTNESLSVEAEARAGNVIFPTNFTAIQTEHARRGLKTLFTPKDKLPVRKVKGYFGNEQNSIDTLSITAVRGDIVFLQNPKKQ